MSCPRNIRASIRWAELKRRANVPRCRFCGEPVYEGNTFKTRSGKVLYLCIDCWELLSAVIEEAIPEKLRQFMDAAETAILKEDRLKTFHVGRS